MAARRTERLLNLVICLLHTRTYLTAGRIRELVAGYDEAPSDEAFKRMFERDKEDLRDLGIPLETGTNSSFDDEPGYRIAGRDYALPDIVLEPAEAVAVGLAARMWSSAAMAEPATRALRKLEAAGAELVAPPEGLEPSVDPGNAGFAVLAEAVHDGRAVTFAYRRGGQDAPSTRTVEPWGVVWWHGRWYLVGHDRDRDATRVFRLSRIEGEVKAVGPRGAVLRPDGADLTSIVADYDPDVPSRTARVRVRPGRCHGLRRRATAVTAEAGGDDVLELPFSDADGLAAAVLSYGAHATVLEPDDVVAAVTGQLRAIVEAGA